MGEIAEIGEALLELVNSEAASRLNVGVNIPDSFPIEVRQLYAWRNGERWEDMFNPIFNFRLLPFDECMSETAFFRKMYPRSRVVQESMVLGSHAYGNGSIIATPLGSGRVELGNLITEDGIIYGTHDGVLQLMKATLLMWKERGDITEISRRFSLNVGRETVVDH